MKIAVYSIEKNIDDDIKRVVDGYIKMSSRYATLQDEVFFNKNIAKAQTIGSKEAKNSYTKVYEPLLRNSYSISLDVMGEQIDSFEFADMLKKESRVDFFIGGTFGLEKAFLEKTKRVISLSRITYAHKIAKIVLFEQIYRGLCINSNHPYHK